MKRIIYPTCMILIFLMSNSCKKEAQLIPFFSLDLFETNIINNINFGENSPIGWAYVIGSQGQLERQGAFGEARLPIDGGLAFTIDKKINIASITKYLTAIAAMQLIYANNLNINSPIDPWLPSSWTRGPGVNTLTFADLLRHRSGLQSTNTDFDNTLSYEALRNCIETGVVQPKERNYLNVNFALFRVLIPSLWNAEPNHPTINIHPRPFGGYNIESDFATAVGYLTYLDQHIFSRCGLSGVSTAPEPRNVSTLYYNVSDRQNNRRGLHYQDWSHIAGGGGYFMTARELGAVLAYFEHTELLLPNNIKEIMKSFRIGFNLASNLETRGNYYNHDGSIINSGQGVQGVITIFPNGIQCVVLMNTQGVTFNDPNGQNNLLRNAVYDAYNNAWVE